MSGGLPAAIRTALLTLSLHGVMRRNAQSGLSGPSGQIIAGSKPTGCGTLATRAHASRRSVTHSAWHSATATSCCGSQ